LTVDCITEIFIFGDCTELEIKDKKITTIRTDEQELKFQILCTAVRYTREQQVTQQQKGNQGLANLFPTSILQLLDQLETLTRNSIQQ